MDTHVYGFNSYSGTESVEPNLTIVRNICPPIEPSDVLSEQG